MGVCRTERKTERYEDRQIDKQKERKYIQRQKTSSPTVQRCGEEAQIIEVPEPAIVDRCHRIAKAMAREEDFRRTAGLVICDCEYGHIILSSVSTSLYYEKGVVIFQ